jgi:outer membrane protein TolC
VVQAQSQLATGNQNLIVAQTNLQLQQYLMLNAVARNVTNKTLASVSVVPTDRMDLSSYTEQNLNADQLTDLALKQSPALLQSIIDFENRDISRKSARNALLPSLDLFAFYGGSGVTGDAIPCNPATSQLPCPTTPLLSGGLGSNLSNLFTGNAPDKGVGVNLSIPIFNRFAQAEQIRADLETQQAQLRLQQLKNQIIVNIKSAVYTVTQDRAQVDAARSAQDYATQNLAAEQKKYALGASTSYNVMTLQNALTQAEQTLLTAVTAYEKARVNLDLQTNQTLSRYNIGMTDAIRGQVTKQPSVPGVAPSPNTSPTPSQQQQQQQNQPPTVNPK